MMLVKDTIIAKEFGSGFNYYKVVDTISDYVFDANLLYYIFSPDQRPYVVANGQRDDNHIGHEDYQVLDSGLKIITLKMDDALNSTEKKRLNEILNHYFYKIRVGVQVQFVSMEFEKADFTIRWLNESEVLAKLGGNKNVNGKVLENEILLHKPIGKKKEMFFTVFAHEILHTTGFDHIYNNRNIMNADYVYKSIYMYSQQLLDSNGIYYTEEFLEREIEFPNSNLLLLSNRDSTEFN